MAFKVSDYREHVLELLDDESGDRYARETGTNTVSYRKMDRFLRIELSAGLDEYVAAGGDRFDEELDLTTSATDGTVDIPGERIAHIRNVRCDNGTSKWRIQEGDKSSGGLPDRTERDLVLTVVRLFELPDPLDANDLIMGTVDGAARSFDGFDGWICARTAMALSAKDKDLNAMVATQEARLRQSIMGQKRNPGVLPWGEREPSESLLNANLRWLFFPHEQQMQLVFGGRR